MSGTAKNKLRRGWGAQAELSAVRMGQQCRQGGGQHRPHRVWLGRNLFFTREKKKKRQKIAELPPKAQLGNFWLPAAPLLVSSISSVQKPRRDQAPERGRAAVGEDAVRSLRPGRAGADDAFPRLRSRRAAVRLRRATLQPAHLHRHRVLRQQEEGGRNRHPAPGLLLPEHPGELPHARDGAVRHEVLQLQHVQRRAGDLPARRRGPEQGAFPAQPPPDDLRPAAHPPRPRGAHGALLLESGPAPPQEERPGGHGPHAEGIDVGRQHFRGLAERRLHHGQRLGAALPRPADGGSADHPRGVRGQRTLRRGVARRVARRERGREDLLLPGRAVVVPRDGDLQHRPPPARQHPGLHRLRHDVEELQHPALAHHPLPRERVALRLPAEDDLGRGDLPGVGLLHHLRPRPPPRGDLRHPGQTRHRPPRPEEQEHPGEKQPAVLHRRPGTGRHALPGQRLPGHRQQPPGGHQALHGPRGAQRADPHRLLRVLQEDGHLGLRAGALGDHPADGGERHRGGVPAALLRRRPQRPQL